MKWERWQYGWGETLKLANGLSITVSRSDHRNEGFIWQGFGLRSKRKDFETIDDAKKAVMKFARIQLTEALAMLDKAESEPT